MSARHIITMDGSGRIVIPKALRDDLAIEPGQPLRAQVRDGRLEIEPQAMAATLVERDGLLVIVPAEPLPPLTNDQVRDMLEELRR